MRNTFDKYLEYNYGTKRYCSFTDSVPLMFITHRTPQYTELDEVKMVLEGGCTWIQLRMKDNLNIITAKEVVSYMAKYYFNEAICCIDDNLEIAMASNADAIHLGKNDTPVSEAWKILIEHKQEDLFFVGATANTFEDIMHADKEGASYVGLGPYRFTETKKNLSPVLGLEGYRKIMQQCRDAGVDIPVFAIGGINLKDVRPLMETGITGIAVSGAIINADDPVKETQHFVEAVNKYKTK